VVHILKADRYSVSPNVLDVGTKGSYGNDFIRLALSSDWDGLAVKISFFPARLAPIAVVCGESDIEIPWEVYEYSGEVAAVISGEITDRIMISLPFILKIEHTYTPANTPPRKPTPSEMSQVYEYMKTAVDTAESVRRDADNGVFDGEKGEKGDKGDKGDRGKPFEYEDFTPDQLEDLKGADGDSPTVEVRKIDNGHRVSFTDKNGTKSIDIMNGKDGEANYNIGTGLHLNTATNTLSVDTTDTPAETDARPITSQGVYNEFAVINALLKTI
jgi:hypothetical protein